MLVSITLVTKYTYVQVMLPFVTEVLATPTACTSVLFTFVFHR
jgi:hypothetical protein